MNTNHEGTNDVDNQYDGFRKKFLDSLYTTFAPLSDEFIRQTIATAFVGDTGEDRSLRPATIFSTAIGVLQTEAAYHKQANQTTDKELEGRRQAIVKKSETLRPDGRTFLSLERDAISQVVANFKSEIQKIASFDIDSSRTVFPDSLCETLSCAKVIKEDGHLDLEKLKINLETEVNREEMKKGIGDTRSRAVAPAPREPGTSPGSPPPNVTGRRLS